MLDSRTRGLQNEYKSVLFLGVCVVSKLVPKEGSCLWKEGKCVLIAIAQGAVTAADANGVSLCAIPASHHLTLWSLESSEDALDVIMQ